VDVSAAWSAPASPPEAVPHVPISFAPPAVPEYVTVERDAPATRGRKVGALIGAGVLGIAAIGGLAWAKLDSPGKPKQVSLALAAKQTSAAKSAHAETTMTIANPVLGDEERTLTFSGDVDFVNGNARLNADLGSMFGSGDFGAMFGDQAPADMTMETLVIDKVAYIKMPFLSRVLGKGENKWIKLETNAAAGLLGDAGSGLGSDGATSLGLLAGLPDDKVQNLGSVDLDGVRTTHFRAELSADDLIAATTVADLPDAQRSKVEDALAGLTGDATLEAWVDDDGLVRRQLVDMTVNDQVIKVDTRYSKFGEAVNIVAPAASDVIDMPGFGNDARATEQTGAGA
jgi:hypothetical protein